MGSKSHLCLYEGGNVSTLTGVHSRQLMKNDGTGEIGLDDVRDAVRDTYDDHYP